MRLGRKVRQIQEPQSGCVVTSSAKKMSARFPLQCLRLAAACCLMVTGLPAAIEPATITFDHIRALAEADAKSPYTAPADDLPPRLGALSYDDYRNIRYNPEQALWRDDHLPFQLEFFHRGGLFRDKVTIREFSTTHEQVVPFERDYFSYQFNKDVGTLHSSLGYAGFRVHTPLNRPGVYDELIAFLGASYFRAIGAQQLYGLSSRGVAINCGLPDEREEFPRFTDFWVGKPKPGDTAITIYALLKGPSVNGAYEFVVHPGADTLVDIRTELIFRRVVTLPGVAILTSMFWFGENSPRPAGEMRQEVHDSDGLLVEDAAGRHLWQPLHDPAALESSVMPLQQLIRFGLLQRDRRITSYEDLEADYEQRPSAWVEPQGNWGSGSIRLVQLPAGNEYGDNIVAFWVPTAPVVPGRVWQFAYRIVWSLGEPPSGGLARVVGTREGILRDAPRGRLFWIDFADERFSTRDAAALSAEIQLTNGARVRHYSIKPYPQIGGWRVAIEADAAPEAQSFNVRCRLRDRAQPISETWVYSWKS